MIPRAEYLWITARECSASVAGARDPEVKKLFGAFATLWRALAEHLERIERIDMESPEAGPPARRDMPASRRRGRLAAVRVVRRRPAGRPQD